MINPFKYTEDNISDLYYVQPIIFKSMYNAQLETQKVGTDIKLYTINYPEDDEIIPEYFIKLFSLIQIQDFRKLLYKSK